MDHVDALVGHLAWPLIALAIVLIFRKSRHSLLDEIRQRVSDKNASLSLTAGPVDLQVTALDDKVRAIAENQTVLDQAVRDQIGTRPATTDIPRELVGDGAD